MKGSSDWLNIYSEIYVMFSLHELFKIIIMQSIKSTFTKTGWNYEIYKTRIYRKFIYFYFRRICVYYFDTSEKPFSGQSFIFHYNFAAYIFGIIIIKHQ